ncbi:CRISPR-associated protein Csd1 [Haloferula luteola]|uniref:CRISPR-associated protein Csd1 n=1 Tax=Haloferula luteola TaxID=595692 RepID=A0A840V606_9BACT|nr:type I-C CRISPR-associated protein Cas8c/Csd1 [Haloferula luteola]MBB5353687.1 CRISPR-associated protein Csd1 [Haloferula luteola]
MNWIDALYRTYENCLGSVGVREEGSDELLLPLSHTTQNAHIEVTLDQNANLIAARVLQKADQKTVVPCTEKSGGRSGKKPETHPLCDKLQYVAGDFVAYGGEVTSGFANHPLEPHEAYLKLLGDWQTKYPHPKVGIVLEYVQKSRLIRDLVAQTIIPVHAGSDGDFSFLEKWTDEESGPPDIFTALPNNSRPQDAFIRWAVAIPGDPEPYLWQDKSVWQSWNDYYKSTQEFNDLCYVTGEETTLAIQHPAKLRHAADKAKLISANDGSGFTFRGRFTDPDGTQTCGVSFDVTQKAHNALRWLIARQGKRFGDQAIVAWAVTGQNIPDALVSTQDLFGEEEFLNSGLSLSSETISPANTAQGVGLALKKKLGGYHADLGDTTDVIFLSLDSATPGRMAISYYRELSSSEFLARVEKWHEETAWPQNFGKDRKFIGAPSPLDIAQSAYGTRLDDKLKSATYRRLLPCIIENRPIPTDLVSSCIQRASNRQGMEHWEWEKALGIACALYRKQRIQTKQHHHTMSLERDRTTRSYLYGRLLAVADVLEQAALRSAGENRDTNAARFMQRFAIHPYETWMNIYLSLDPYRRRLKANAPGLLHLYDAEFDEIKDLFKPGEFNDNGKLEGEFLLAYHCQRTAFFTKKEPSEEQPA